MAKVLVVDDNLDVGKVLVRLVKSLNVPAVCVGSGPEALKFVEKEIPRVILLDWMMPQMNGLEVLRTLRANPKYAALPVVIFSALADPVVKRQALEAGAQEFVVKTDLDRILRTVEKYVMRKTDELDTPPRRSPISN
jgi:CheY-like chemotaxis protein